MQTVEAFTRLPHVTHSHTLTCANTPSLPVRTTYMPLPRPSEYGVPAAISTSPLVMRTVVISGTCTGTQEAAQIRTQSQRFARLNWKRDWSACLSVAYQPLVHSHFHRMNILRASQEVDDSRILQHRAALSTLHHRVEGMKPAPGWCDQSTSTLTNSRIHTWSSAVASISSACSLDGARLSPRLRLRMRGGRGR